jgi:4-diphosphocytidyl-2-C-methyl-D-erythritol kinase
MTVKVFAPAKINLSLRVGPPGLDARHPLDSLVCFTRTCGDNLRLTQADALGLAIDGPFAAGLLADADNLVMRAAQSLRDFGGIGRGAAITLTKRLPIASGIGGGSADAAAALIGLNQLWGVGARIEQLQELGAKLGADVPACVQGTSLRMTGTGETTVPVGQLPRLAIVLVNPLVSCPTGPVYKQFDRMGRFTEQPLAPLPEIATQSGLLDYLRATPNDLEAAAIALVPQIGDVLSVLAETGDLLLARMSGSGSTCFGLYSNLAQAQAAAVAIKTRLASYPIWVEADEIK